MGTIPRTKTVGPQGIEQTTFLMPMGIQWEDLCGMRMGRRLEVSTPPGQL